VTERSRLRLVVLQVLVLSLLLTLLGRLWFLQILTGDQYQSEATKNGVRNVVTTAVRGQILDDEGRSFVRNRTTLVVTLDRNVLERMKTAKEMGVLGALAKRLSTKKSKVTGPELLDRIQLCGEKNAKKPPICWSGSPFQPIPVAKDVAPAVALGIMERQEDFPGVAADFEAVREYPYPSKANAAHLLGYIGPASADEVSASQSTDHPLYASDQVGKAGLEAQYDDYLRGLPGVKKVAIDYGGRVTGTVSETPATPGDNLVTNIDANVQRVLEQQLLDAIARARSQYDKNTHKNYVADSASGVVLDVSTGRVVAMASVPTYDPSVWIGGATAKEYAALTSAASGQPLSFRAMSGTYPPGSTFKVVSSSAMLDHGYSAAGPYDCPSSFKVGPQTFTNYEGESGGRISLKKAIEISCDTVFYQQAFAQWIADGGLKPSKAKDLFINEALAWGVDKKTGIDLPSEARGSILTRKDRYDTWVANRAEYCYRASHGYPEVAATDPGRATTLQAYARDNCAPSGGAYQAGDAVNFIIGQGETLLSPLKMAQIYAAIANGGTLWQPQVAKAVIGPDGKLVKRFTPKAEGKLPISASTLAFLQDTLPGVTTDGTGRTPFKDFPTSLVPIASKTGTAEVLGKQTTGWFASYGPANAPKGAPKYAIVMMVTQGGTGALTSGASVNQIYRALLGVAGKSAPNPKLSILPGGVLPVGLPVVTYDGRILPPGSKAPKPPVSTIAPSGSSNPATPSSSGDGSTPAVAEPVYRPAFGGSARRSRAGPL